MDRMQQFRKQAEMTYTLETLPPHPAWCERSRQPRRACASEGDGGVFSAVTHNSSWRDQGRFGPVVYLERTDMAGFGLGADNVTICVGVEEHPMSCQEARELAAHILALCDLVDETDPRGDLYSAV